jgi:hypothetical protein
MVQDARGMFEPVDLEAARAVDDGRIEAVGIEDIDVAVKHAHAAQGMGDVRAEEVDRRCGH